MTTQETFTEETALVRAEAPTTLARITRQQRDLLKRTIAKGATDDELALFLTICGRRGLDPFSGQIHFVKYGADATIIVGIEGLRAMAEDTGDYAGQEDAVFGYDESGQLMSAQKTVYRWMRGERIAFTSTIKYGERVQTKADHTPRHNWAVMPETMLAKCAEADAFRKAFPQRLGGLYIGEEMEQADSETARQAAGPPRPQSARPVLHGGQEMEDPRVADPMPTFVRDTCPVHDLLWRHWKGEREGRRYDFWSCPHYDLVNGRKEYCNERPERAEETHEEE